MTLIINSRPAGAGAAMGRWAAGVEEEARLLFAGEHTGRTGERYMDPDGWDFRFCYLGAAAALAGLRY